MEEIIRQLIQLEEKAQALVKDAKDQKEHFAETIDQDVEKLHQEINEKVLKKDEKISQIETEYAKTQIENRKAVYAQAEQAMMKKADENMEQWVQQIYAAVLAEAAEA